MIHGRLIAKHKSCIAGMLNVLCKRILPFNLSCISRYLHSNQGPEIPYRVEVASGSLLGGYIPTLRTYV